MRGRKLSEMARQYLSQNDAIIVVKSPKGMELSLMRFPITYLTMKKKFEDQNGKETSSIKFRQLDFL